MILIKNGRLIDPKSKRDEIVDILIEEDKIKKIEKECHFLMDNDLDLIIRMISVLREEYVKREINND